MEREGGKGREGKRERKRKRERERERERGEREREREREEREVAQAILAQDLGSRVRWLKPVGPHLRAQGHWHPFPAETFGFEYHCGVFAFASDPRRTSALTRSSPTRCRVGTASEP